MLSVVGYTATTAVGVTAAASAAAVRADLSHFFEHGRLTDWLDRPAIVAAPPDIAEIEALPKALCAMAARAIADLDLPPDTGIFVALPEQRPGVDSQLGAEVCAALTPLNDGAVVRPVAANGHAAGGAALPEIANWLAANPGSCAALVGVDSYLHPDTVDWLAANRQLHATYNAWGFIPGAASCACLLASPQVAQGLGRQIRGTIETVQTATETVPIKTSGVCLGKALTTVIRSSAEPLGAGAVFHNFLCDLNGEPYRADEIGFMLTREAGRFRDPSEFVAPADCWGDVGAATVPLLITLACEAAARGYSKGPVSLISAGSENGLRTGVVLRTPTPHDQGD